MKEINIELPASIHLIGICGTGMGALACLLKTAGFDVTGSDSNPYPPMSEELKNRGIEVFKGYGPNNLNHNPDLVVVGNVCGSDHPEVVAAKKNGLTFASMPKTIHDLFLSGKESLVIAGTHGKTTTTALVAHLLEATGRDPSVLLGGVTKKLGAGSKLGKGIHFVIEGDEYDSAYFEKFPKFFSYSPHAAVITSVEHDHVDIYPSEEAYLAVFRDFAKLVSKGPLAAFVGDQNAAMISKSADVENIGYALSTDPLYGEARWSAKWLSDCSFGLFIDGQDKGIWQTTLKGNHNLRNTLAALIMTNVASKVPLEELRNVLPDFAGVARRQELIGTPKGIFVYDDFAHHPTAIRETLDALEKKHGKDHLIAAFEPRSATACRRTHQEAFAKSFDSAALTILAPVSRDLPPHEKLDTLLLASQLKARGLDVELAGSIDDVVKMVAQRAKPGDAVVLMSNGSFGGVRNKVLKALK